MGFAIGRKTVISFEEVLNTVSLEEIASYYLGIKKIPIVINSPFRIDKIPSFSIFYAEDGMILFKDFGNGDKGSIIDIIKKRFNYLSYEDVIERIEKDFKAIKGNEIYKKGVYIKKASSVLYSKNPNKTLQVKVRDWEIYDLNYWNEFGITMEWLKFGKVYPISHIFLDNTIIKADKHAYCYVEYKDDKVSIKVYQPFHKIKWLNNHDSSVWDLWEQAMNYNSDSLIITSSRKDALSIWATLGVPSISLQSEGYYPKKHIIEQLKHRFNNIYILYDNDYDKEYNKGRDMAIKISKEFDIKQIEIPQLYESKDPSDLYKKHGIEVFKKVFKQLIKN